MARKPFVVTFSGVDGSGKSQHIILLRRFLRRRGIPSLCLHSVGDSLTNKLAKKIPFGEKLVGWEKKTVSSQKGNMGKISLFSFVFRYLMLILDALYLRIGITALGKNYPVIIFDRYVFDKLVHLYYLRRQENPNFSPFWINLYPKANLSFYLRVLPEDALARKQEIIKEGQSLDYLSRKINLFEKGRACWKLVTVDTSELSISQGKKRIISIFKKRFLRFLRNK